MKTTLISLTVLFLLGSTTVYAAETGAQLYEKCQGCHGAGGDKTPMGSPPIKGQSSTALEKILQGYTDGTFGGANKKIMVNIMHKYTEAQRKALAEYMGTL